MSWGKKSKKKPSVLTNFYFLVNFIRHTGPMVTMVTRCTGSLSQLPVVEMSWGKKSKKKTSVPINFRFLVNFIRHTGPIVTMVTRCTGSLSELPVAKMSWGKKSKKKLSVLFHFVFWSMSSDTLVPWSPQVNSYTSSLSQWSKLAEGKNLRKKPNVLTYLHLLVYFIRHTSNMVNTGLQLRILNLLSPINFFPQFFHVL